MPDINTLPPAQKMEFALLQQLRVIHDMARFHFTDYYEEGKAKWAAQTVIPDEASGVAIIPDAYFDPAKGQLVVPPNAAIQNVRQGSLSTIAVSAPELLLPGSYNWTEPAGIPKRGLDPEDLYSPFVYGGVIIFSPGVGDGPDQFRSVCLIPADWKAMAEPAFLQANPMRELLDGQSEPETVHPFVEIICQPNCITAVLALREALRQALLLPQSLGRFAANKDKFFISVAVYFFIAVCRQAQRSEWMEGLTTAIDNGDLQQLQTIATGAFTAMIFPGTDPEATDAAQLLLATVNKRLKTMGMIPQRAPELFYILEKSGPA